MTTDLLDVNVLMALTNPNHVHHHLAHRWFADLTGWATTPATEAALVRLTLNPTVMGRPVEPAEALTVLTGLRQLPRHRFQPDDASLAEPAVDLAPWRGHAQTTDFQLINLCARHGLVLATFDRKLAACLLPADRRWVEVIGDAVTAGG